VAVLIDFLELIRRYYAVKRWATRSPPPCGRVCGPPPPRKPTCRVEWGYCGCRISGWPSNGGIIIHPNADAIELAYLGLDRFDPPMERLKDQKSEGDFCKSLLRIGGTWWPCERLYKNIQIGDTNEEPPEGEERKLRYIGWSKIGGVWVVEYTAPEEGTLPEVAADIGRLRLCFTMEERCEMLRDRVGATFYEDPKDFYAFRDL
jgi:hypothetical protein